MQWTVQSGQLCPKSGGNLQIQVEVYKLFCECKLPYRIKKYQETTFFGPEKCAGGRRPLAYPLKTMIFFQRAKFFQYGVQNDRKHQLSGYGEWFKSSQTIRFPKICKKLFAQVKIVHAHENYNEFMTCKQLQSIIICRAYVYIFYGTKLPYNIQKYEDTFFCPEKCTGGMPNAFWPLYAKRATSLVHAARRIKSDKGAAPTQ